MIKAYINQWSLYDAFSRLRSLHSISLQAQNRPDPEWRVNRIRRAAGAGGVRNGSHAPDGAAVKQMSPTTFSVRASQDRCPLSSRLPADHHELPGYRYPRLRARDGGARPAVARVRRQIIRHGPKFKVQAQAQLQAQAQAAARGRIDHDRRPYVYACQLLLCILCMTIYMTIYRSGSVALPGTAHDLNLKFDVDE